MEILDFQIKNYKSFWDSGVVTLGPGLNVIVGQNNAGKTAIIEALTLRCENRPHRSLRTLPTPRAILHPNSSYEILLNLHLSYEELIELIPPNIVDFDIPTRPIKPIDVLGNIILESLRDGCKISFKALPQANGEAYIVSTPESDSRELSVRFKLEKGQIILQDSNRWGFDYPRTLAARVFPYIKNRIYHFKAERMNIGFGNVEAEPTLEPNASNLAQALHYLQSNNPTKFNRFNKLVNKILPEIQQIVVSVKGPNSVGIDVWPIDSSSEHSDLAIPLTEGGTGISQVLAIIYVVLTSIYPMIIIIDEPQSFLHPGAVRKLFDILKDFPQHQYIVTTHSPSVINSSNPSTILMVKKESLESSITTIDVEQNEQLRLILSDVGVRLSDVFGADNILWVEGQTEELCFPLILEKVGNKHLLGTTILAVLHTGDFEPKHAKSTLEIYNHLSKGRGLLPPAIGFIFDSERKTDRQREDLIRQSGGKVHFLKRHMYENYLLHPQAIAALMNALEGFSAEPISAEAIQQWLDIHQWDQEFFRPTPTVEQKATHDWWINHVHGAKVLEYMFKEFSKPHYEYDKVKHGLPLTQWIVEREPEHFREIANLMVALLDALGTTAS